MREILFRGKTYDGKWILGYYVEQYGAKEIYLPDGVDREYGFDHYHIIPETVGQYTGLIVPSGKIFEHDVVTAKFKSNGARFNFTVKYDNGKGCYVFDNGSIKVPFDDIRSVRIIGNIFDNSEQLKGGGEE